MPTPTTPPATALKLSGKLAWLEGQCIPPFNCRHLLPIFPFLLRRGITRTHFFPHLIRISFVAETIYIIVMCAWRNLRGCLCSCFVLICLFVSPHCWARGPSIIHYCKIEQDITNGDIKTFKSPQNLKKGAVSIDIFQSQGIGKDKLRKSLLNTIDSKTPF